MIIKNYVNKISGFIFRRLAEVIGITIIIISVLLLISLASYSPEDPNFILSENQKINNFLGLRGSYVADILFQSIGLISILLPFSLFFGGLSIVINKNLIIMLENEAKSLVEKKISLPAYDQCLKASHIFNILDSRGAISVAQRAEYIGRIREITKSAAGIWIDTQI